jgi:hypothetical protein
MKSRSSLALRCCMIALLGTAMALFASAGETPPAGKSVPSAWKFEGADPWKGWRLKPAEPRESGMSQWETLALEFAAPASGRVVAALSTRGAGSVRFDGLELYLLRKRKQPLSQRRTLINPGFDSPAGKNAVAAAAWKMTGNARRSPGHAFNGPACLLLGGAGSGPGGAQQEMKLKPGARYRLLVRVKGELTSGHASAIVHPAGIPKSPLAEEQLRGSTLRAAAGRCGRLRASRGSGRVATLEFEAESGKNYTLESLLRGRLEGKARLRVELSALAAPRDELLLATRLLSGDDLGVDWRPLRINFALRGARKLRLTFRLDGPALVEIDELRLLPPRVIPRPRRLSMGDAADNFRPKGRRPLITSRGKQDGPLVRTFARLLGKRVRRPTAFWQFWRTGRAFDHQARPFSEVLKKGAEDGSVWLLDASRKPEAKWLAGKAVTVPERPGAYAISVKSKGLIVAARSEAGFLAAASALGWLSADGVGPEIFSCQLEDWPAYPLRAAELSFDGRLAEADRRLLSMIGTYRLGHVIVTGQGFWRLPESKTRSEARDLFSLARSLGLTTVAFIDAFGVAPALAEKSPQSVEMIWHRGESHYLRGTERSFLGARNVVPAAGCPVEVSSARGKTYANGKDYQLVAPAPRLNATARDAPRSWLRRLPNGSIPDGGRVLLNYNALPSQGEQPAACPRAVEPLEAFRKQLQHVQATGVVAGIGLGGRLPRRMRTDKRTAGTRFKNGRLAADRLRELLATASLAAPKARCYLWADLLNPCGGLQLPDDSPASSAELIDPALRSKLTVMVRLDGHDVVGRDRINKSARFLLSRGYNTVGWCGSSGEAAELWAASFAAWQRSRPAPEAGKARRGQPTGLVFRPAGARPLELERFAEAAWRGAPQPAKPKTPKTPR